MTAEISVGVRVRFAPNPRFPDRTVDAQVIRRRNDPRPPSLRSTQFSRGFGMGWLDTKDDEGTERSVRPSRCMVLSDEAAAGRVFSRIAEEIKAEDTA